MVYNKRQSKASSMSATVAELSALHSYGRACGTGTSMGGDTPDMINGRIMNGKAPEKFYDGVPERVANNLWEKAKASNRDWKGNVNVAAANKTYQQLLAENKAAYQARVAKRLGQQAAKAAADAELRKIQTAKAVGSDEASSSAAVVSQKERVKLVELIEEEGGMVPDSWEELDDRVKDSISSPAGSAEASTGVKIVHGEEPLNEFSTPHGHQVLAYSRAFMMWEMRKEGVLKLSKLNEPRACVFEIGAASSGILAAIECMDKFVEATGLFFHCTYPIAECDDLCRDHLLLGRTRHAVNVASRVNWVDRTGMVVKHKVNVCSHLARDCPCMAHYTAIFAMTGHASYYFRDTDWARIFSFVDDVRVGIHLPEYDGQIVPSDQMEFSWQYLKSPYKTLTCAGLRRGTTMLLEQRFFGKKHVQFVPRKEHGTTYVHRDPAQDVRRGGFHLMHGASWGEWLVGDWAGKALLSAGLVYGSCNAANAVSDVLGMRSPVWSLMKAAIGYSPAAFARAIAMHRDSKDPMPITTKATVKVIPGHSIVRNQETIARVYHYRKTRPCVLEDRVIETNHATVKKAAEMAASMALSKDSTKAARSAVAMGFRAGMSPAGVRDTVATAMEYLKIAEPKNDHCTGAAPDPPGPSPASFAWVPLPQMSWDAKTVRLLCWTAVLLFALAVTTTALGAVGSTAHSICLKAPGIQNWEMLSDKGLPYWEWFLRTRALLPIAHIWQ